MRLQHAGMTDEEREAAAVDHARWLLQVGDGLIDGEAPGTVKISQKNICATIDHIIGFIYPAISNSPANVSDRVKYYAKRAILAPTNNDVDD